MLHWLTESKSPVILSDISIPEYDWSSKGRSFLEVEHLGHGHTPLMGSTQDSAWDQVLTTPKYLLKSWSFYNSASMAADETRSLVLCMCLSIFSPLWIRHCFFIKTWTQSMMFTLPWWPGEQRRGLLPLPGWAVKKKKPKQRNKTEIVLIICLHHPNLLYNCLFWFYFAFNRFYDVLL